LISLGDEWKMSGHNLLMFKSDFSQVKLWFAVCRGIVGQRPGKYKHADVFKKVADSIFMIMW
jgi:hypothetical protein